MSFDSVWHPFHQDLRNQQEVCDVVLQIFRLIVVMLERENFCWQEEIMTIFFYFDPSIIISIKTQKQNNLTREGEGLNICNPVTHI
jgi:hypothetical protein